MERMMKILHVDTSITGPASVSRTLSAEVVEALRREHPGAEVTVRDLTTAPIGHLSAAHLLAAQGVAGDANLEHDLAAGASALGEFLAADIVVVGAPMYNFSVPSQLKAWIDRLAVPGATFRYTERGPVGLAVGKKAIVVSSRGGFPAAPLDHQEAYLRTIFGFFGIEDVTIVRAEGVALSDQARASAISNARRAIEGLVAQRPALLDGDVR